MTRSFDEATLSAFIDGELDASAMQAVDRFLADDVQAREFVLNSVRGTALLKARLNAVLHAEVPEGLVHTVRHHPVGGRGRRKTMTHIYRLAAAIILVVVGYLAAMLGGKGGGAAGPFEIAPLLSRYGHVMDATLENNLSGTPEKWQMPEDSLTVTVTPVRTYRDSRNQYYREFRLQISGQAQQQEVSGLAYRTGTGKWKTKAIFF